MTDRSARASELADAAGRVVARVSGLDPDEVELSLDALPDPGLGWQLPVLHGARVVATLRVDRPREAVPLERQYAVQDLLAALAPRLAALRPVREARRRDVPLSPDRTEGRADDRAGEQEAELAMLADLAELAEPALGGALVGLEEAVAALAATASHERAQRYLSRVATGTDKLSAFRRSLAAYAAAGREPRPADVDLAAALDDARTGLHPELAEADATVLPAQGTVRADPELMSLLLRHAILLGLRGPAKAPVTISVGLGDDADGPSIWVRSDSGGAEDPHPSGSQHQHVEGGDLNLAICSRVAVAHGGGVTLAEGAGGTALAVHLPRLPEATRPRALPPR